MDPRSFRLTERPGRADLVAVAVLAVAVGSRPRLPIRTPRRIPQLRQLLRQSMRLAGVVGAARFWFRSSPADAVVVAAVVAEAAVDSAETSCRLVRWSRRELTWFV